MQKIFSFLREQKALSFILITMFLNFLGFSILIPVLPFLILKYIPAHQASLVGFYVGLLMSIYALCQFFAAPGLGVLSDRFGRRPILLLSLLGSVVGYILLGVAGAMWVLFLGRIIDGLTGGNISTVFAYIADITEPKDRGKYYGYLGAAGGFGFMIGPVIGGYTGAIHLALPFYIAAAITLVNMFWGYFVLPESLPRHHRAEKIMLSHVNPFGQFRQLLRMPPLRVLFGAAFLFFFPLMAFQALNAIYMKDVLNLGPAAIGTVLFVVGIIDIFSQGYLTHKLLPVLGERALTIVGLILTILGYALFVSVSLIHSLVLLYVSVIVVIIGDGLFEPSMSGLISNSVEPKMQGRVQGANQSMQSATRVVGPLYGGWAYNVGIAVPYIGNMIVAFFAVLTLLFSSLKFHQSSV